MTHLKKIIQCSFTSFVLYMNTLEWSDEIHGKWQDRVRKNCAIIIDSRIGSDSDLSEEDLRSKKTLVSNINKFLSPLLSRSEKIIDCSQEVFETLKMDTSDIVATSVNTSTEIIGKLKSWWSANCNLSDTEREYCTSIVQSSTQEVLMWTFEDKWWIPGFNPQNVLDNLD